MHRIALAIALAAICALLQIVRIPYAADFFGQIVEGGGSLVHLQAGLLLALAMLDRSRLFLRCCMVASAATWVTQTMIDYGSFPWSGLPLFVVEYGVTIACARLAGFPQKDPHPLGVNDVLRTLCVALLVFPTAWTVVGTILTRSPSDYGDLRQVANAAVQTAVAKHFGASIVTLPMVMLFTEKSAWIPPGRQRDRLVPFLLLVVALATISVIWRGIVGKDGDTITSGVLEYLVLLSAILAWVILRFPPRVSMPSLALVMLGLAYAVATSTGNLPSSEGLYRLLLLAVELMVLQGLLLVLYVVTRTARGMHAQLSREATTDTLTGLPNLKALRECIHEGADDDRELGYLFLDNTEGVLSGLGLKAYEALMTATAAQLRGLAEAYYLTSGRFILRRTDAGEGLPKWSKLVEVLERFEFTWEGVPHRITPYLGIARLREYDEPGLDETIAAAAQAAAQARVQRETEPISAAQLAFRKVGRHQTPQNALTRTSEILSAIRSDKLVLHFQPMRRIDPSGTTIVTAGEVLCRLRMRNGKMHSPEPFLSELEAAGRLVELDRAVVRQLMNWLSQHRRSLGHLEHVGVNLTGQSLTSQGFMRELLGIMRNPPLPPSAFCFEITESAIISDVASTRRRLEELRSLGCRIAIDDFGAGMQSFQRLKQLPFDLLKIDGSFVRGAKQHPRDYELVKASVTIAHAFGVTAAAEYVEDSAALECMRSLGVHWGQGYALGRPQPIQLLLVPDAIWPTTETMSVA